MAQSQPDAGAALDRGDLERAMFGDAPTEWQRRQARKQIDELLNRQLSNCSGTWLKDMCRRFNIADGERTNMRDARTAIATIRDEVRR